MWNRNWCQVGWDTSFWSFVSGPAQNTRKQGERGNGAGDFVQVGCFLSGV